MAELSTLRDVDIQWLLRKLPARLRTYTETASATSMRLFIAGGFVRSVIAGEPINDIDVFTDNAANAQHIARGLAEGGTTIITTPNALTVRASNAYEPAVQIITRWTFGTLEECIESFDFTIARSGITYANGQWMGLCDADFYADLAAKRLTYRAPDRREDEAGSMLRMLKFYGRGYRAPLHDIAGVVARSVKGIHEAWTGDWTGDSEEQSAREFVLGRLRVIDPAADPEQEGHLG